MEIYNSEQEYSEALSLRAGLPRGFRCGVTSLTFTPEEKASSPLPMNLTLILGDEKTDSFGAMFTRNKFPGAPVIIGKERMAQSHIRGFLVNNKISNVCAPGGVETARGLLKALGAMIDVDPRELLPFSTGIIGWKLPSEAMKSAFPSLIASLQGDSILPAARAIMTTDAFPKVRSIRLGEGRITAIAKGAGMIEPNMATMLVFILTDLDIPRQALRQALGECVKDSFNCLSVDGDQSTSDTVLLMSSRRVPDPGKEAFTAALHSICLDLAEDIVRNGEGTEHVIKVTVRGKVGWQTGRSLGKAVVNSQLVKAAIFGNDPNVGRLIMAIGDHLGIHGRDVDHSSLSIRMGGRTVFQNNAFHLSGEEENFLSGYLKERQYDSTIKGFPHHNKNVEIDILFGGENPVCTVWGSDLSYEYVRENADYRS